MDSKNILDIYSPIIPIANNWTPETKNIETIIEVYPGTSFGEKPKISIDKTLWIIKVTIVKRLIKDTKKPKALVIFKGRSLKLKIPSEANLRSFLKLYFGDPANLESLS